MKSSKITLILLCFIFVFFYLTLNVYAESKYVVLMDAVNIRKGPGTNYNRHALGNVGSIYYLNSEGIVADEAQDGSCDEGWYEINYNGEKGYVCSSYVKAIVDTEEEENKEPTNACEAEMKIAGFPSSYWNSLCSLKEKYPNWTFKAIKTNIEWTTAVDKFTSCGDSLVSNPPTEWLDTTCSKSEGSFKSVNQEGVAHYLDPRNYLDEKYIFQFEHSKYNEALKDNYSTIAKTIIENTAFYKYHEDLGNDLSALIAQAGEETNISPTHIASRMYQELGANTRLKNLYQGIFNGEIKGTVYDFTGLYNFYNIGVTGSCVQASGMGATYCGLTYAKNNNWNTLYEAVKGGGTFLSKNYVDAGQYTSYLERFNVVPVKASSTYLHYYMANLGAPSSEATTAYNAYKNNNLLNSTFEFHIPTYTNMNATIINSGSGAVSDSIEVSNPAPSIKEIGTIIVSAGYKASGEYITTIETNTTIETIKNDIEAISGNGTVSISDTQGDYVGTGSKITINNSVESKTYKILIKGDTSGDGIINAKDLLQVQKHILGTYKLNDVYKDAGDTSSDDIINAKDLLQIQKNILGTYTIKQ